MPRVRWPDPLCIHAMDQVIPQDAHRSQVHLCGTVRACLRTLIEPQAWRAAWQIYSGRACQPFHTRCQAGGGGSIEGIHLLQAQTFWLIRCACLYRSHAIHRLTHMHANVSFVWTRDGGACFPYIHST